MLLKLAAFLMLNRFFVGHTELHHFLSLQIGLDLFFLTIIAPLQQTEKSAGHQLVFNISVQILVFWVLALHGALKRLFFIPLAYAIRAKGRLTDATLFRVEEHLEAYGALEVGIVLLQYSDGLNTLVIFEDLFRFHQRSGRQLFRIQLVNWLLHWLRVALGRHALRSHAVQVSC